MSVKTLLQYLEKRAAATAATAATPDTRHTNKASQSVPPGQPDQAASDPARHELQSPLKPVQPQAPNPDRPVKQTFMQNADTWRHFDRAYQAHHFKCPVCIASGLGYGLRCGTGSALWIAYSDAA